MSKAEDTHAFREERLLSRAPSGDSEHTRGATTLYDDRGDETRDTPNTAQITRFAAVAAISHPPDAIRGTKQASRDPDAPPARSRRQTRT